MYIVNGFNWVWNQRFERQTINNYDLISQIVKITFKVLRG